MNTFARLTRMLPALIVALTLASPALGQSLIQQAGEAYEAAQEAEFSLRQRAASDRSRAEYLRVIRMYERVYLITPHTGYADNALVNIAALYEEIDDPSDAAATLSFLVREYPASRFLPAARSDIARLTSHLQDPTPAAPVSAPLDAEFVSVNNIRYWESQRSVRVVVDLNGEAAFVQGDVRNPPRVFVDIKNSRVGASLIQRELPVRSMMLENIRVGQYEANTVRVVLDLVNLSKVTTFTLRDPDRLVIDVLGDDTRTTARLSPVDARPEPAAQPRIAAIEPRETGPVPAAVAAEGVPTAPEPDESAAETPKSTDDARATIPPRPAENGDNSLIRSLGLKVGRVVIDPGHGGRDTGTIGPTGLAEKDLVLDIATRLKSRIESELGAEVVLTRDDDLFVPLETRTAMANQAEADLFLSIHANSSRIQTIRGFETYFLNFATSRESSEIAARENAASAQSISELQDLVSKILLRDKVEESREFATHIQRALETAPDLGRNRGVKQAPFVVLIGANMPSILAEVSFISNPDDEELLKVTERRDQIAAALFEGVRSYSATLSGFETAQAQD